jgi:hypothetical protein
VDASRLALQRAAEWDRCEIHTGPTHSQQRTVELGVDPAEVPARVQKFLKGSSRGDEK